VATASYNPHGKALSDLPVIYGFNNGGSAGCLIAQLISQDGLALGSHMCSSESFMPYDLGIVEGSRPDRHEQFRASYPDGYRMEFVSYAQVRSHSGLEAAFAANKALAALAEAA